jgi:hypothetical protein
MNARQWKATMADLLKGVEANLRTSAPASVQTRLRDFRKQLAAVRTTESRARFERRLETYLQSAPYLRGAVRRYIAMLFRKVTRQLNQTTAALKRVERRFRRRL